ncbi:hypothetical protein AB0N05_02650 [Nocardia sp. NPDC051030]
MATIATVVTICAALVGMGTGIIGASAAVMSILTVTGPALMNMIS